MKSDLIAELNAITETIRRDDETLVDVVRRLTYIFNCDLGEMEHAFGQNILRRWDRERTVRFAAWLLGDEQTTALDHLDAVIAAYDAPGILPLVNAARAAKQWRSVTSKTVEHAG